MRFCPHKDMEGLPGWGISSMPRPAPRQNKHERRYTPFTHLFILTRRIWKDDYDGQIIFGDLLGLKFPDNCLTGHPGHNCHPGNLSRPGIEPGPAAWQARMLPPASQRWNNVLFCKKSWITFEYEKHVMFCVYTSGMPCMECKGNIASSNLPDNKKKINTKFKFLSWLLWIFKSYKLLRDTRTEFCWIF